MQPVFASLVGPDLLIVIAVVALLFGGSQIPRLARSLGSAKREFEQGLASPEDAMVPGAADRHASPDVEKAP